MKKIFTPSVLLLLLVFSNISAQENKAPKKSAAGISAGIVSSANGYGMRYEPMLFVRNKRTTLFAGVLLMSNMDRISGAELKMDYALTGCNTPTWQRDKKEYACNRKLELSAFLLGVYNTEGYLTNRVLREEKTPKEGGLSVKNYAFKSAEAYAGFSLKFKFLARFQWSNSFGLGACYTLNYPGPLYYDKLIVGLLYKTEITMRLTE